MNAKFYNHTWIYPQNWMQTQFRAQKPFPKDDAGNDIENSMTKPTKYYLTKEMVCRASNEKLIDILPISVEIELRNNNI